MESREVTHGPLAALRTPKSSETQLTRATNRYLRCGDGARLHQQVWLLVVWLG